MKQKRFVESARAEMLLPSTIFCFTYQDGEAILVPDLIKLEPQIKKMDHTRAHRTAIVLLRLSLLIVLGMTLVCSTLKSALAATHSDDQAQDAASSLSKQFRCPEEYSSDEAKQAALRDFIRAYTAQFPQNDVRDLMIMRYRLLIAHSCIQTLKSMLTRISPVSEILRFEDDDLGPRTEEYDPETKVWSVWFRKDGEPPSLSVESLIFNFYQWPDASPESIADAFVRPRPNLKVIGKFGAPDELTKKLAFFIVSETLYSDESYGYVNISKISSVGTGVYTVTLARKITGTSKANIEQKGKAWFLSAEGQAYSRTLDEIGVDPSWERYFAKKAR